LLALPGQGHPSWLRRAARNIGQLTNYRVHADYHIHSPVDPVDAEAAVETVLLIFNAP
jgi:hypothetical protein